MFHAAGHDFSQSPLNVYWEVTLACDLACRHCRAEAICEAPAGELTTREGIALLDEIARFEPRPNLVITGGDPLKRADLPTLIQAAVERGLSVAVTPSATPRLTEEAVRSLKHLGVQAMGLSLDGSTRERHDAIRGVDGCFARTIEAARWARQNDLLLQVNTLVSRQTLDDLPDVYQRVAACDATRWSLFFLVEVGRGTDLESVSPAEAEEVLEWLTKLAPRAPMMLATTEAPFYRRVLAQHRALGSTRRGVRDGHGVVFVSSRGDVCPAGFLPLAAGNVRQTSIVDLYQSSPLFQRLHDASSFSGRCGICDFRSVCGGSRSRAFAATGDPFASDPACAYEPR
jgi:radical SAM protein with 4Fe4S-binding SPASM domain